MKHKYVFNHDHYYHTLKQQIGSGIPVFHGVRQRGGGLGSVLGSIAKYAIPLVKQYIIPHAKNAILSTVADVTLGRHSLKESLKNNSVGFLKNVGNGVVNKLNSEQSGRGLIRKRKQSSTILSNLKKKVKNNIKKRVSKSKVTSTKRKKNRTKQDIFS